jgi:hypothetical protein
MTVKQVFEQYDWCKHAFARDSDGMGIPAINRPRNLSQPTSFSLTGAIHFAYRDDAIQIIYKCKEYIQKKYRHPFTLDEWQDNQQSFDNIALLIEELDI